jgi:hypothetical protein
MAPSAGVRAMAMATGFTPKVGHLATAPSVAR